MKYLYKRLFFVLLSLTLIFSASLARADSGASYYQNFINGIGAIVYKAAWPTATYYSVEYGYSQPIKNGAIITFKVNGISAFDNDWLWTEVNLTVQNGEMTNLAWGKNNAVLVAPGVSSSIIADVMLRLGEEYKKSQTPGKPTIQPPVQQQNIAPPVIKKAKQYSTTNGYYAFLQSADALIRKNKRGNPSYCKLYSNVAIQQHRRNVRTSCRLKETDSAPIRWNYDAGGQYQWCLTAWAEISKKEAVHREQRLKGCLSR